MARTFVGLFVILIGISAMTGIHLEKFLIAIFFIAIGIKILVGRDWSGWNSNSVNSSENLFNEVAIFSPVNRTYKSSGFKGGKVVAIFAGGEMNLKEAVPSGDTVEIEYVAIFGGGKLIIPKDWRVASEMTAILGGIENKSAPDNSKVTLKLKGVAIFGGLEITN